ncbi:MAG TPA: histidine phosphatase family protein [Ktedonobacterales bacterium]|jgi:probable phosphoglycerate mutase
MPVKHVTTPFFRCAARLAWLQVATWVRGYQFRGRMSRSIRRAQAQQYTGCTPLKDSRMKRKLLLIRHGQTTFNVEHRLPGQLPGVLLNEEGKRQAQQTGAALTGLPIGTIITSPLERAYETATLIAQGRDIPFHVEPDLADTNVGKWAGMDYNELFKSDPEWQLYVRQTASAPPGVESSLDVQARAVRVAERARRAPDLGEYVVLVAHADVIKLILAYYTGMQPDCVHFLHIDNASVSLLAFGEGEHPPTVLALNWTPSPGWLTYTPDPPAEPTSPPKEETGSV